MDDLIGLLRIRVLRGINLVIRDFVRRSSDPYIVFTMDKQKVKTKVVNRNCNPEWNDELTLCVFDPIDSIHLAVYNKDHFSKDDKMGEAEIDIKPYMACLGRMMETKPNDGALISLVQPSQQNSLAKESCITWKNGKLVQDMRLRLNNVACGEVELEIELMHQSVSMNRI